MPFGGIDESGLGLGGMHYTMNEYSYSKMITWQT
jgi:acyl-CoA reductase-like NAD-dependent aldehyde dehydrogenase